MSFGENLQQLRKEKGWSQEELADRLEVSRQAVSKWESDAACPETEKLVLLSDLFHVSVDSLLRGRGEEGARKSVGMEAGGAGKHPSGSVKYRAMRTAFAVGLYAVSPFWFYIFGESPGGSGRGAFCMFLSIVAATGLLVYNHAARKREAE